MIAKHIPMKTPHKSHFSRLVAYLHDPQDKQERVGRVRVTNCQHDQALDAVLEVQATQALNQRTQDDKTYHLILSFRPGESPPAEVLAAIETQVCVGLGYGDHQRVSVVHHDTDNVHVHIAINKIHPQRHTIHTPYYDHKKLGILCGHLEQQYGLQVDNHEARKTQAENRADDLEAHSGIESLLTWVKRQCAPAMQAATSWTELHAVMAQHSLELREQANGLIVMSSAGVAVKASSVARSLSKAQLEKRLGAFARPVTPPATQAPAAVAWGQTVAPIKAVGNPPLSRRSQRLQTLATLPTLNLPGTLCYRPQPLVPRTPTTTALYTVYQQQQHQGYQQRCERLTQAQTLYQRQLATIKRTAGLKRLAISMMTGTGLAKTVLYALLRRSVEKNLAAIHKHYRQTRTTAYSSHQRQTWADWLHNQATAGQTTALAILRARQQVATHPHGNTIGGVQARHRHPVPGLKADHITKSGTIRYRIGSTVLSDRSKRIHIVRGTDIRGLAAAVLMARYRYDDTLTVRGDDAFKTPMGIVTGALHSHPNVIVSPLKQQPDARIITATISKETPHDQRTETRSCNDRRRHRSGADAIATSRSGRDPGRERRGPSATSSAQSDLSRARYQPPPAHRHRVRDVSQLGVVQLSNRGQVLLPRDVPHHLEHDRAHHHDAVRRPIYRPTIVTPVIKKKGRRR